VQIDGFTSDVMDIEPLEDKWRAFGWEVFHCNGHEFEDIVNTYQQAMAVSGKPSVIIAKTLMGKGVPEIENDYRWHGKPPKPGQVEQFVKALDYDTK
jgi:transketolase